MKHTKIIFLSILNLFLGISALCQGQNSFEFTIKDALTDQIVGDAIELSDGSFIILAHEIDPPNQSKAHLMRLSKSGALLQSKTLTYQGQSSGFKFIVQTAPNRFVLSGYTKNSEKTCLWLYEMDSLFIEVKSKLMPLNSYSYLNPGDLTLHDGKILCSGNVNTDGMIHIYRFIYKISPAFDSLNLRIFTESTSMLEFDLLVKNNDQGYYGIMPDFNPSADAHIVELDTAFAIKNFYGIPNYVSRFPEARWLNNSTFIFAARKEFHQDSLERITGVMIMDTLANLKYEHYIGDPDTSNWPGLYSSLDFTDKNGIYVGGTHNFHQESEFYPENIWFSLTQMDSVLNVHWQHFYGGDANYTLYGIRATRDKGCLMFGSRYDFQSTTQERDIYVIKVDQNGLITGTGDQPSQNFHQAIVFPNPGSDHLIVQSGPQLLGAICILRDMNGKMVLNNLLTETKISLDTHELTPGTYIWQIIQNNKLIENGKWIKY